MNKSKICGCTKKGKVKAQQEQGTWEQAGQCFVCWWYLSRSCSRVSSGAGVASRPIWRQ